MAKPLTFSTNGLSKIQIDFLTEIEAAFIQGKTINRDLMYRAALKYKGKSQALEIIEAFNYWEFLPRPIIRESLVKPLLLSELVMGSTLLGAAAFSLTETVNYSNRHVMLKHPLFSTLDLIYPLHPENFYLEIINDRLYIKYQRIIGGRFIAIIKNDLF